MMNSQPEKETPSKVMFNSNPKLNKPYNAVDRISSPSISKMYSLIEQANRRYHLENSKRHQQFKKNQTNKHAKTPAGKFSLSINHQQKIHKIPIRHVPNPMKLSSHLEPNHIFVGYILGERIVILITQILAEGFTLCFLDNQDRKERSLQSDSQSLSHYTDDNSDIMLDLPVLWTVFIPSSEAMRNLLRIWNLQDRWQQRYRDSLSVVDVMVKWITHSMMVQLGSRSCSAIASESSYVLTRGNISCSDTTDNVSTDRYNANIEPNSAREESLNEPSNPRLIIESCTFDLAKFRKLYVKCLLQQLSLSAIAIQSIVRMRQCVNFYAKLKIEMAKIRHGIEKAAERSQLHRMSTLTQSTHSSNQLSHSSMNTYGSNISVLTDSTPIRKPSAMAIAYDSSQNKGELGDDVRTYTEDETDSTIIDANVNNNLQYTAGKNSILSPIKFSGRKQTNQYSAVKKGSVPNRTRIVSANDGKGLDYEVDSVRAGPRINQTFVDHSAQKDDSIVYRTPHGTEYLFSAQQPYKSVKYKFQMNASNAIEEGHVVKNSD